MSQLAFTFDAAPTAPDPQPPILLPHRVKVPADPTDAPDVARKLFKVVDQMYAYSHDHDVFRRFLRVVDAVLRRFEPRGEADYMAAINGMDRKIVDLCGHALGVMIDHFWYNGGYADILGPAYMEIRSNWKGSALGQFFTPWNLCVMMATMKLDGDLAERIERGERVSACDPACGSGATLLALRAVAADRFGRDVGDRIALHGQDIDELCVLMARIQLRMSHGRWMTNFMIASYGELAVQKAAA